MTAGILVYFLHGAHVLLVRRKSGLSIDKWNGLGGQVQFGETVAKAAGRTSKELGLTPILAEPLGEILYHHPTHGNWKVTVFRTESFSGEPQETDTMFPHWHPVDAIPYEQMWAGDDLWLPHVIDNTPFIAEIWFNADDKIRQKDIQLRKI